MNSYIKNKRKTQKLVSTLNIIFWILNFVFAELSVNMLMIILNAEKTSWFDTMKKQSITMDMFFIQKTEFIMETTLAVMIVIVAFTVMAIVLMRSIQLKNILNQIAMYRVVGYDKKKLMDFCMMDAMADIMIAFPISVLISVIAWKYLSQIKMVSYMVQMTNESVWIDVAAYVSCVGILVLATVIHTKVFLEQSLKKGIRYMLGKGVV